MLNIACHLFLTGGFFCLCTLFYRPKDDEVERATDSFFADLERPEITDDIPTAFDLHQRNKLGNIVVAAGVGLFAMMLIPNPAWGRVTYLLCALSVLAIGVLLRRSARVEGATAT
jgi:hypothetical protein